MVQLTAKNRPDGKRFVVKDYPKDREWRRLRLAAHLVAKIVQHAVEHGLGPDDLIFFMPDQSQACRYRVPDVLPDPETLGWTEPNEKGRRYRHGTATAYGMARCRCRHCKDAVATYRAARPEQPVTPDLATVIQNLDPTTVRQLLTGILQQTQPVQQSE